MGLRPGRCYREVTGPAYTRLAHKVQEKDYLKGGPAVKIRVFNMGTNDDTNAYEYRVDILAPRALQIRHESLEAARLNMNNYMGRKLAKLYYGAKVLVFPHHVLRENKQASGAGADRIQQGMARPFGRKIGRAARVMEGQKVISIWVFERDIAVAKEGARRALYKLTGGGFDYVIEKLKPKEGTRTLADIKLMIEENPELAKTESQIKEEKEAAAAAIAGAAAPADGAAAPAAGAKPEEAKEKGGKKK